jgi:hypothetical protein
LDLFGDSSTYMWVGKAETVPGTLSLSPESGKLPAMGCQAPFWEEMNAEGTTAVGLITINDKRNDW